MTEPNVLKTENITFVAQHHFKQIKTVYKTWADFLEPSKKAPV